MTPEQIGALAQPIPGPTPLDDDDAGDPTPSTVDLPAEEIAKATAEALAVLREAYSHVAHDATLGDDCLCVGCTVRLTREEMASPGMNSVRASEIGK